MDVQLKRLRNVLNEQYDGKPINHSLIISLHLKRRFAVQSNHCRSGKRSAAKLVKNMTLTPTRSKIQITHIEHNTHKSLRVNTNEVLVHVLLISLDPYKSALGNCP